MADWYHHNGTRLAVQYPRKASEFLMQYPGQIYPQTPRLELIYREPGTYTMVAGYNPDSEWSYNPNLRTFSLPLRVRLTDIRELMEAIAQDMVEWLHAVDHKDEDARDRANSRMLPHFDQLEERIMARAFWKSHRK